MSSSLDASILGSTQNGDAMGSGDNALSFNDSDFYLNMDDVDIGPQIGQGAFSKVYLGRYLGELVRNSCFCCLCFAVDTQLRDVRVVSFCVLLHSLETHTHAPHLCTRQSRAAGRYVR